jgi:hypothetical protein
LFSLSTIGGPDDGRSFEPISDMLAASAGLAVLGFAALAAGSLLLRRPDAS